MNIEKYLGDVIRSERMKRNWSQLALAQTCSIGTNYLGVVERGEITIGIKNLVQIAMGLEIRPSGLLRLAEERALRGYAGESVWRNQNETI